MVLTASIPSPGSGVLHIGPFPLRAYGLLIAVGAYVAYKVADRRWIERGGAAGDMAAIATWAIPAGLVGARLYHVITDYELYTDGRWRDAFKLWQGGLGIWGAIAGGTIAGVIVARHRGMAVAPLLDAAAPGLALAQAIGRWGNWFNQELFGRPTSLPWGLRIDFEHRPAGFERFSTFHPTFLYESLWCLAVAGLLLLVDSRARDRIRPGNLFALYVAAYTFGRFWFERLRIDFAHRFLGLRLNDWTSVVVFVAAVAVFAIRQRGRAEVAPSGLHEVDEIGHTPPDR